MPKKIVMFGLFMFMMITSVVAVDASVFSKNDLITSDVVKNGVARDVSRRVRGLEFESETIFNKLEEKKYNYAPSIIRDGDRYYSFFCTNKEPRKVIDSIGFVESEKIGDKFYHTSEKKVLNPSKSGVDSQHVCDPSVIKGEFKFNDVDYDYLMGYLCCVTTNNQDNDMGLAVSNDLINWEKWSTEKAFIDFKRNTNYNSTFQWGIGQPSLINLDEKGIVAIFYTYVPYNDIGAGFEVWDLSNMNEPKQLSERVRVSDKGLINLYGQPDFITNADFMLDGETLYMYVDTHPYSGKALQIVADETTVYKMDVDLSRLPQSIAGGQWVKVKAINQELTGFSKNHDVGFVRDWYGHRNGMFEIAYTSGVDHSDFLTALFSYTVQTLELPEVE